MTAAATSAPRRRFAWRRREVGGHSHIDLFVGWENATGGRAGELIMDADEADDLIAMLGAAAEACPHLCIEEARSWSNE